MRQQDGFSGGFLLGTIVGGVVGGVVGALIATKQLENSSATEDPVLGATPLEGKPTKRKGLFKPAAAQTDMEAARRSLEDKIAQLNDAIDDVRQQLGGVNGSLVSDASEQAISQKPRGQS